MTPRQSPRKTPNTQPGEVYECNREVCMGTMFATLEQLEQHLVATHGSIDAVDSQTGNFIEPFWHLI